MESSFSICRRLNSSTKMVKFDKGLTAVYFLFCYFLPLIIIIKTNNTTTTYNINKKSGQGSWKLSEKNYLQLKGVHIPGRINVATN
jgi:hypothetical protein